MEIKILPCGLALGLAWSLCACGEQDQPASLEKSEISSQIPDPHLSGSELQSTESEPASGAPAPAMARHRADALGFARHLPADVEGLISVHRAADLVSGLRELDLWKTFGDDLGDAAGPPPEAMDDEDFSDLEGIMHEEEFAAPAPMMSPLEMLGSEVTLALGKGGGERLAAWLRFNDRASHYQMRNLAAILSQQPRHHGNPSLGSLSMLSAFFGALSDPGIYADLAQDREAIQALDAFRLPPIYLAVRAEGDAVNDVHAILSEPVRSLAGLGEIVAPVEITRAGATFQGHRLIGEAFAASMAEARESMVEQFGEEVFERFIGFLKSRDLVAVSGTVGGYAVLFFGASEDEFQLADSPETALTHGSSLAFADPHLDHPLIALVHGGKTLVEQLTLGAGGLAEMALGLRDGFASNDRDARNRDLVALLDLVAERERALRALATQEATDIVLVDDGGPRLEARGGTSGMLDYAAPARLAALGDDPDAVIFLNWCVDPRYSQRSLDYSEALLETGYALALRLVDSPQDSAAPAYDQMAMIRQSIGVFTSDFRTDVVDLWHAIAHDMRAGLGREAAIVVDFSGTVPVLPGAAKPLAGVAGAPRIAYLAQVQDREKLAAAWQTLHASGGRIAARVAKMNQQEFAMPNPIRSESNGFSSWFLPLPFFDDEFLPSVTLNDSWFAVGTSRNQSLELAHRLDALEPHEGGGMRFAVHFPRMVEAQRRQLASLREKRDAILETGEIDADEFDETLRHLESLILGLGDFGKMEGRWWREDGVHRTSIHVQMN